MCIFLLTVYNKAEMWNSMPNMPSLKNSMSRSCIDNLTDGATGVTVANSRIIIVNIVRPYKANGYKCMLMMEIS